ncbi:hypothetical protein N9Q26_00675 [bacterium]|nr:hypothetical protein [bacterium]MDC0015391.1 hypothetical protein [Flavobacteriales bacterium]
MSKPDIIQLLKIAIQRQFGMSINTIAELKIFQEELEYRTREVISFNTLRRFFDFLPSTKPSSKTIRILCKYLGFNNISNFLSQESIDKNWQLWNKTLRIELTEKLDERDLLWLKENSNQPDFYLHLTTIIKSFIYRKKYGVIVTLFEQEDIVNFSMNVYSKFASILCRLLGSLNKNELQNVIIYLIPIKSFRESVLHWYIDYTNLNGYYGDFLEAALPASNKESHEYLFYQLILNYRSFLSNIDNLEYLPTSRIKKDYFVVLKGRSYSYNLVYYNKNNDEAGKGEIWNEILFQLDQNINIFLFMLEIMITLLLLKEFDKISYLIDEYYEELLSPTNWTGYHLHSTVLLGHSVQLLYEGSFMQAKKTFQLINTTKIDGSYKEYNMIFYHLIEYQIALTTHAEDKNLKAIENKYLGYVQKTGFTFFSVDYLKKYLLK